MEIEAILTAMKRAEGAIGGAAIEWDETRGYLAARGPRGTVVVSMDTGRVSPILPLSVQDAMDVVTRERARG